MKTSNFARVLWDGLFKITEKLCKVFSQSCIKNHPRIVLLVFLFLFDWPKDFDFKESKKKFNNKFILILDLNE